MVSNLIGPALDAPPPRPARAQLVSEKPGLSGKQAAVAPTVEWGAMAALVFFGAWYFGRRWRRFVTYAISAPVFLFLLFFFYSNVARLLPANF